jgi:hypothetical protein
MLNIKKLYPWIVAWLVALVTAAHCATACSSAPLAPQTEQDAVNACAVNLAQVQFVKDQAAKLNLEPIELANRTCATAVLGIQIIQANLAKSGGASGAPSTLDWLPMSNAGVAGK